MTEIGSWPVRAATRSWLVLVTFVKRKKQFLDGQSNCSQNFLGDTYLTFRIVKLNLSKDINQW